MPETSLDSAQVSLSQALRERGYRLTPQRLIIAEAVEKERQHFSAEEVFAEVRRSYPHLNISTVYRTLDLLAELGLVTQTDLGEGRVQYHGIGHSQHHHLVCQNCGQCLELDDSLLKPLERSILEAYGFRPQIAHFAIFGLCQACQKEV